MATGLRETPGVEVLNDVVFTQVVAAAGDDATTRALGASLLQEGTAALTPGRWLERAVLRCSMSNWSTTPADVQATVEAVRRCLGAIAGAS
jgi:hypothetical protein